MKVMKTLLVILVAVVLLSTLFGCKAKTSSSTTSTQQYTVKRGNLSLDITAAGNLALSVTQDLPVNLFYPNGTKGTIASVLVQLGDSVKAGEVLVTIDNDEWNDQMNNLVVTLTAAQRNLTQMQSNLVSANQTLTNVMDTSGQQKTILSDEIALEQAQTNLATAVSAVDFSASYAALQKAQTYYDYVNNVLRLQMGTQRLADWELALQGAQDRLTQAQTNYDNVLSGYDSTDVAQKKRQVQIAQMTLDAANAALANNPQAVALQQIQVTLAQGKVTDAQKAVSDAQKKMTDAQAMSPEIKAPFDGFVTKVNVAGGDQVPNGTIAVTVADPNKFQMNILVSEMDIMKVSIGGDATITLNAITGLSLPAKVTQIAPTATISSGVVNYAVTVNVTSIPSLTSSSIPSASANATGQFSAALQQAVQSGRITQAQADALTQGLGAGGFTPAQIAAALQQAVQSGRITQAQADALAQQSASAAGGFTGRAGTSGAGASSRATGQLPSTGTQNYQLKQGLTGTVDLIVSQRTNVLLVPNTAITKSGTQSTVQVVTGNTTATEKRIVQTGLADWQNTEITSGLSEGEKIIVPKTTTAAAATTASQQRAPGIQQILR